MKEVIQLLNKLKPFILYIIIGGLLFVLFTNRCDRKIENNSNVKIDTIIKTVYLPEIIKDTDTIYLPSPVSGKVNTIKIVDSSLLRKYEEALDQIKRDSIFKAAITINEYEEIFEDSLQKIKVNSKVRGNLLAQSLNYKLKPRRVDYPEVTKTITKETLLRVRLGADIEFPIVPSEQSFNLGGNISLENSKGDIFELGYNSLNEVKIGYKKSIFNIKK